jgi:hypothetical protein
MRQMDQAIKVRSMCVCARAGARVCLHAHEHVFVNFLFMFVWVWVCAVRRHTPKTASSLWGTSIAHGKRCKQPRIRRSGSRSKLAA